ncbi:MAG: EI24 domain-containing protein, partial [Brachymonas denitrificans]
MKIMLDAFWRALAYCLHPRVILLSLLPLLLMVVAGIAFAQWGWWPVVDTVRQWLDGTAVQTVIDQGFDWLGVPQFKSVIPSLLVVVLVTPLIVILSLLAVATLMTPALVKMVGARRFPDLERRQGAGFFPSLGWSLGHTLLALGLLVVSIPFWFIPPLVLVVPPLIWGWLTYRVMSFDAWAEHASKQERRALMQRHRFELLTMGIVTG